MQAPTTKILFVITQGEWGGAQRYVFDLATHLTDNFEVYVAAGEPNGGKELLNKFQISNFKFQNKPQIQIIQLRHLLRKISPINDTLAIFELAKLYKTLKPDIVHLNSSKAGILGSLAKLLIVNCSLLIVYTVHGWVFNEPNRWFGRWLYRFLEKLTARWKDKIIVLSPQDFASGRHLKIPEKKLVEIPLGIDAPKFLSREEARQKLSRLSPITYHPSLFLIGAIANLYPTKGIDVLIDAINLLKRDPSPHCGGAQDDNVRFVVIGEGPERKRLEHLIKKYDLGSTVFLIGSLESAAQYLPAFDLFVLPSRKEGLPYTILEAMRAKIPTIATEAGGVPSLIENKKNGLLAEPEDPNGLSQSITYALKNPQEMRQMADKAFEKVQNLNLEQMTQKTTSIYSIPSR